MALQFQFQFQSVVLLYVVRTYYTELAPRPAWRLERTPGCTYEEEKATRIIGCPQTQTSAPNDYTKVHTPPKHQSGEREPWRRPLHPPTAPLDNARI